MVFALLHHPPKLDVLNLTLQDINGMDEELAIKLWEKLEIARERTVEAYKGK
jgi:hypothetical protein